MKTLYMIGGPMGVGKTTISQRLKKELPDSVFLDGDWCWDSSPFVVNEETKRMVTENISFLLNQFIHTTVYENIIFCWVMHEQEIIEDILNNIDGSSCKIRCISLLADEDTLIQRLQQDIDKGIRMPDVIKRSIQRIPLYNLLDTIKIDTTHKEIEDIVKEIMDL